MDKLRQKELERLAYQIRITGLEMVQEAHSGHIGERSPFPRLWQCCILKK